MDYFIYKHTNKENGKCYIGQTKNIKWRWYPNGYKYCSKFYRAILKYGWDNFTHEILKVCDETNVDYFETYYIKLYDSIENGYNLDSGGCKNKTQSQETIQKKIEANKKRIYKKGRTAWNKGLKASEETRKKLSISHLGQNLGTHLSDETKKKISQANKGKFVSKETRIKLSISHKGQVSHNKGKKMSEETKEKIRQSCLGRAGWRKGKPLDENTKEKLRQSRIGSIAPNRKKVINIETSEIFDCIGDACKKYGICIPNLSKVVNGKREKAGGYHWQFYIE